MNDREIQRLILDQLSKTPNLSVTKLEDHLRATQDLSEVSSYDVRRNLIALNSAGRVLPSLDTFQWRLSDE